MVDTVGKLNRLAKWRSVFAGWQLGTRSLEDPECQAVRDHREGTMFLRVEVSAITAILIKKGIITIDELNEAVGEEADALSKLYEERFPGFKATNTGMTIDPQIASKTMNGWRP